MTTLDLLTKLKAAHGGASDYRVAQILGIRSQTVYQWKSGKQGMSDEVGIRAAKLLGLDEKKVLLDLHIERNKENATSPVWKAIRDKLEMSVVPMVVGLAGYSGGVIFGGLPI